MSSATRLNAPREIGLALAPGRLTAHIVTRSRAGHEEIWQRELSASDMRGGSVMPDLTHALTELRESLHLARARASLALMPPLVQLKRIELPRMKDEELRTVLTRDASRYFFDARETQVIAFERRSPASGPICPIIVVSAREPLVEAILAAARESGWDIDRIVPAHAAWCIGAAPHSEVVAVGESETITLTTSDAEHLASIRRSNNARSVPADESHRLAAANAVRVRTLQLLPARYHDARARRTRIVARVLLAAAAACVLASVPLELWGTRRELRRIEARRAAIKTQVDGVMRLRDALAVVDRRLTTLTTLEQTAPQWSSAMSNVASHLPLDAYLVAFRGRADSLVLEGTAERATGVFEAIQQAPGVSGVRANAPIRQELDQDQQPVEHFAVALRLAHAGSLTERKQ